MKDRHIVVAIIKVTYQILYQLFWWFNSPIRQVTR